MTRYNNTPVIHTINTTILFNFENLKFLVSFSYAIKHILQPHKQIIKKTIITEKAYYVGKSEHQKGRNG